MSDFDDLLLLIDVMNELGPRRGGVLSQGRSVADDPHVCSRSGEHDIHSANIGQEPDGALGGSHRGGDDDVFFAALEAVDGVDFDGAGFGEVSDAKEFSKFVRDESDLLRVGSDDGGAFDDAIGRVVGKSFDEGGNEDLDKASFFLVDL